MTEPVANETPLKPTRALNRITVAWAFYDFANSAYAALIAALGYQVYFKKVVLSESPDADLFWAILLATSILASAFVAPFVGASADAFGLRKRLFVLATVLAAVLTGALSLVGPGQVVLGFGVFFLANCSYNLALVLYDSYLKIIADPSRASSVSGFAWGLGYLGGVSCALITFPLFSQEPTADSSLAFRAGFLVVGAFYLLISIPAMKLLPGERPRRGGAINLGRIATEAYVTVVTTLRTWQSYREIFKFLIAFYFVTEVVATTIYFAANYLSSTLRVSSRDILLFSLITQLVGFPATWAAGHLSDRWNIKAALLTSLSVWAVIVVLLASASGAEAVFLIATLTGLVIGSTQALGRAVLSNLSPYLKISELFGFNTVSTKAASTLGPLVFGAVSSVTDSQRLAWLSLLPFVVVGAVLVARVRVRSTGWSEPA